MVIIEDLLKNVTTDEAQSNKSATKPKVNQSHIINLCDFSGNLLHLIVNQVG